MFKLSIQGTGTCQRAGFTGTFDFVEEASKDSIRSPFSGIQSTIKGGGNPKSRTLTVVLILLAVLTLSGGFFLFQKQINDPLRTLREFPVNEYYENHSSLEGTRFRAQLRAVNQLGWKEDLGRLVVFQVGQGEKPVVVLVPPQQDAVPIEAGEHFQAELRVVEGGLLKASHLIKD